MSNSESTYLAEKDLFRLLMDVFVGYNSSLRLGFLTGLGSMEGRESGILSVLIDLYL